ncbi:MAG TPA: hypothetical protein VLC92_08880 [Rhodocyclaceae bacterium]|nr:hypothetical protein [Rhodocyclaceae bacterium]
MAILNSPPALRATPLAPSREDAFLEKFHPAPLSALVVWLFSSHRKQPKDGPEAFDDHINGLA